MMQNRWSWFGLLLALMILNYTDRQAISGVFPLLQTQFHLNEAAVGILGNAFMFSYAITAPIFGFWSDRWKPHKVAAIGVAVWSLFTTLTAIAWSYPSLLMFRGLVGIGEAAFTATGSTMLSRLFPQQQRSLILGLFNLGLPVGGALGVVVAGNIGEKFGWQPTFLIVGIPGLILAAILYTRRTPSSAGDRTDQPSRLRIIQDSLTLLRRPAYSMTIVGYIGVSFAFGAIVNFAPSYFVQDLHDSLHGAANLTGLLEVVSGLIGAPLGGVVADAWARKHPAGRAYALALALVVSGVCLYYGASHGSVLLLGVSTFFMMWHAGVASSLVFDSSPQHLWNTASALGIFLMHLCLGDAWSPWLTGLLADHIGLGRALSFLSIPMLIAAIAFWAAGRFRAADSRRIGASS